MCISLEIIIIMSLHWELWCSATCWYMPHPHQNKFWMLVKCINEWSQLPNALTALLRLFHVVADIRCHFKVFSFKKIKRNKIGNNRNRPNRMHLYCTCMCVVRHKVRNWKVAKEKEKMILIVYNRFEVFI